MYLDERRDRLSRPIFYFGGHAPSHQHLREDRACPAFIAGRSSQIELAPLLQKRGLALRDHGGGNLEVEHYNGLVIKASYWRWPEHDMAGNAIDFYIKVLGASFNDAMKELIEQ